MFGCICPNKRGQNATCDQVFKAVNGNPCIGKYPIFSITKAGFIYSNEGEFLRLGSQAMRGESRENV